MQPFPWPTLVASIPFMAAMGFTPGPNNILVATSGVNFGFRATIAHILGITFGFPIMLLLVGLGLAKVFLEVPEVHQVFKYLSIVYLLYLAWRVAAVSAAPSSRTVAKPITFMQAAAFQWVNVKAWIIAVTAVTTYTVIDSKLWQQVAAIAVISSFITLASTCTWTLFGHFLRDYLTTAHRLRVFNWGMASLLVLSILPVLFE